MNLSIFDVTGPVMIGPSSSHTAGAAKLARIASMIAARPIVHALFGLHGSFAKTYKGHGTDKALVAGVLGIREDDERLVDAFSIAQRQGLTYEFEAIELEGVHENTVKFTFTLENGEKCDITGSSIGGAQIIITHIGEFNVELSAQTPVILIQHQDKKGMVGAVANILARNDINIGTMKLSRRSKGDLAFSVIETDDTIGEAVIADIKGTDGVIFTQAINPERGVL